MSVDLDLYMSRMAMLMVSLVSPPLCLVFRCRSRFYVTSFSVKYRGIRLVLWFQGTVFFLFSFVRFA